jgi:hypothetical protein
MRAALPPDACDASPAAAAGAAGDAADAAGAAVDAGAASRVVLLAHPDHLRRALRIGETTFARAAAPPCASVRLVPAMQPYRLDWPSGSGGGALDLFAGVPSARVHTLGVARDAAWRQPPYGFYPDGEPQRWAHKREVWLCYEVWARAKGVATGVIGPAAT